jgi:hypothetical protein
MSNRVQATKLSTTEPVVICPKCQTQIRLTESLAAPLLEATRQEYEQKLAAKDCEVARREAEVREQEQSLTRAQQEIEDQIAEGIRKQRVQVAAEEAKKARQLVSDELNGKAKALTDLEAILKTKDEKLAEAQKEQAELLRKQRKLDDAMRELDLTVEKRVQESLSTVRSQAKQEAEDALKLKVAEKEQTISSMQKQIEDLRRKAEQGSQQLQGEVQELELEAILKAKFPMDSIEPVAKGEFGGDILQRVLSPGGQVCGSILWESKRTKNWSDGWLPKLRDDQRAAKADLALLVSRALPPGVNSFDLIEGVWVVEPRCAIPVAIAVRQSLLSVANARQANEGQQTKMGLVYQYLTGPRFRARVEAIVEKFSDMQDDLNKERKTMTKLWAKREEQIRGVIESTAGMYGDLQGIAGKSLHEIEGLSLAALPPSERLPDACRIELLPSGPMP